MREIGVAGDAHAVTASGLTASLADMTTAADLGYVGIEGIELVPFNRFPGSDLDTA